MRYIVQVQEYISNSEFEISQLKKIISSLKNNPSNKLVITRYAIPALYSIWEGFFVKSLLEYINYINSLRLSIQDLKEELLAHNIDVNLILSNSRIGFVNIKKYATDIYSYISRPIFINNKIITESNVNYKVANAMFERLCLNKLSEERKPQLNKLLMFRNNISHGECTVPENEEIINELSDIVINCIYDTFIIIEQGIKDQTFRKI